MGKKNVEKHLGRAIIKERFKGKHRILNNQSHLHTTDLQDESPNLLNLQSITEESSFQEFLSTATLLGTEFLSEKLNVQIVNLPNQINVLSAEKESEIKKLQEENKKFLKIPRRPKWDRSMSSQELQNKEKEDFIEWKRKLALTQEIEGLLLTPYEKNLECWRQLWRVIERCNIILQVVDARNPLLFRCEDLEQYIKEINQNNINIILINKADFLTEQQRITWAEYFTKNNMQVIFFSALLELQKNEEKSKNEDDNEVKDPEEFVNKFHTERNKNGTQIYNAPDIVTREELISFITSIYPVESNENTVKMLGLVGYPNVGKSSVINAILRDKKVTVSKTPGKTKHFQTLYVNKDLMLCDCPGLVMPSFVVTRAEMILNGILPINHIKDYLPAVALLGSLIPRHILDSTYGIMIPRPGEGEDENRPPTAEEILNSHAVNRGFMTQNGQPDNGRSARYILNDFITGKLLYCTAPPGYNPKEFHLFPPEKKNMPETNLPPRVMRATRTLKLTTEDLDKAFFYNNSAGIHTKGKGNIMPQFTRTSDLSDETSNLSIGEKPWKINKKINKKRKEKSRRVYAHLDQH